MRGILETRTPGSPAPRGGSTASGGGSGTCKFSSGAVITTVACVVTAAWLSLMVLPGLSETAIGNKEFGEDPQGRPLTDPPKPPKVPSFTKAPMEKHDTPLPVLGDDHVTEADVPGTKVSMRTNDKEAEFKCPKGLTYEPWGYNAKRNTPRWKHIYCEIAKDQPVGGVHETPFTVVDYGADQGYFSISIAKHFPQARVMGVELGGFGGTIWKSGKNIDVLEVQEKKLKEFNVHNMQICQTKVSEKMFFSLEKAKLVSRYQLVLSVFHWFTLPTSEIFEKTVVTLFKNARTTFIELPTIGDRSKLIRQQVGWDNWKNWYQGYDSVQDVLESAAKHQGLKVKVSLVAALPWLKWTRDVYRVDVLDQTEQLGLKQWGCLDRRQIYGCNETREAYRDCPTADDD